MTASRVKFVVGACAVVLALSLAWLLPVGDWMLALADRLRDTGLRGVLLLFVVYVAATVALVPASVLTLAAGFVYGPIRGLMIVSPISVVAATVAFLLGRTVLRDRIKQTIARSPRAAAIDRAVDRDSFKLILLLRLSPLIPFGLLNYALGLSGARLDRFILASFVGMLPGTWLYVYLGSLATTTAGLTETGQDGGPAKLALTLVGLAATIGVVFLVTRTARRALDHALRPDPAPDDP